MGSNQSRPDGQADLEANAADCATVDVGHDQPQPGSPSSFHLSLTGRQIIGDDGAKIFFPCPISAALWVHHHEDFASMEVPVHYVVKNAALFDLQGAQRLLTRFVDAIKTAVARFYPRQIQLANDAEFHVHHFETEYAREIASMFHGLVLAYIHEYNEAHRPQSTTLTKTATNIVTESQSTTMVEPPTGPTCHPTNNETADSPHLTDAATERPPLKRKASALLRGVRCDNCGEKHEKIFYKAACRSCGDFHSDREIRCPMEGKQCACETYPRHTYDDCPKDCRYCRLAGHPPHRNPWMCRVICCLCGSYRHMGIRCFRECFCKDRHLGQDCPKNQCLAVGCPRLGCDLHCERCGVEGGVHRCQWRRIVDDGNLYVQCVRNPGHKLLSSKDLWDLRKMKNKPNVECRECRENE